MKDIKPIRIVVLASFLLLTTMQNGNATGNQRFECHETWQSREAGHWGAGVIVFSIRDESLKYEIYNARGDKLLYHGRAVRDPAGEDRFQVTFNDFAIKTLSGAPARITFDKDILEGNPGHLAISTSVWNDGEDTPTPYAWATEGNFLCRHMKDCWP